MASLSCDVPASLVEGVQRRARDSGGTVSSVISAALASYLETPLHTLFQISTSGSLVEGVYAQAVTCAKVLHHGNFGLGTFADLDGEMAVLEGAVYRVRGDGTVSQAAPDDAVPFAVVTQFNPSSDVQVDHVASLSRLIQLCDACRRSDNLFYALRLDGRFTIVVTRAVKPQPAWWSASRRIQVTERVHVRGHGRHADWDVLTQLFGRFQCSRLPLPLDMEQNGSHNHTRRRQGSGAG